MSVKPDTFHGISTRAIHAGCTPDPTTGAILTPIYQTATYVQEAVGVHKGYTYTRSHNPTVSVLEKKLGELEGSAHPALCFSTGMAATTTLLLALLQSGDHVICGDVVYGGTVRLLREVLTKFGISASYVDTANTNAVKQAISKNTRLIFIETPANPTLKLTPIADIANIAHQNKLLLVVDNTFLTSALQTPFTLGADIVLYSTTKYIDGHNATLGGALLTQHAEIREKFHFIRNAIGSIQAPFDAWLVLQGIKTLDLRMRQHCVNAAAIATFLENHPKVKKVTYPGLASFKQYELTREQQRGAGGMLTFEVMGHYENAVKVMNAVRLCALAESLGSVETLITHPASMTHGPIPLEQRQAVGISNELIRLSVGLEDTEDIIEDLDIALWQGGDAK